jgi:hypothetical protein
VDGACNSLYNLSKDVRDHHKDDLKALEGDISNLKLLTSFVKHPRDHCNDAIKAAEAQAVLTDMETLLEYLNERRSMAADAI